MDFKFEMLCVPCFLCSRNVANWMFMPLLCVIFVMLLVILCVSLQKIKSYNEVPTYTVVLLVTCVIGCFIIVCLFCNSAREACFSEELVEWIIKSQPEQLSKSEDRLWSTALVSSQPSNLEMMPLPTTTNVMGRLIKTPFIQSSHLTPVHEEGSLIGYTSRPMSGRVSYSAREGVVSITS
jgi:hypothetical protein